VPPSPTPAPVPGGSSTITLSDASLAKLAKMMATSGGGTSPTTGATPGKTGTPTSPTSPTSPIAGLGKMITGFADTVVAVDKFYEAAKKKVEYLDNMAKEATEPLREISYSIQQTYGGFRKANETMMIGISQDMRESYDTFADIYSKTGEELVAAGQSQYVVEEYGKSINLLKHVDITRKEYQDGFTNFIDEFKNSYGPAMAKGLKDRMVDVKLYQENFGLTASELGNFVAKEVATTGKASGQMLDDLKKYSYGLSQQTGISAKLIAGDTVKIINNMERFGNVTVEEAARMSTALKQLGVEYSQLEGMVGAFQGFDQAATKVGELSAVFGIHLDAVEMMNLANTDQEAMMHKIRDAFNESGQSLGDMNIAQKNLLKGQLGFTDMKQMEMFLSGQVDSLDELKAKSEEASTDDMAAKSVKNFNKDISTMTLAGKTSAQKFQRYNDDIAMSFAPIAPAVLDARLNTEVQLNSFEQKVAGFTNRTVQKVEDSRSNLAKLYHGGLISGTDVMKQLGTSMADGMKDLPLTITDAVGGGIDGAISIFEDSLLAPGSLSGVGLSILKGITGDAGATKEGFAKFLPLERAFETSINNILPMTSQLSNILAESGLADAIPAIETAGPLVTTTVSQILQEYQSKLLEIQNINEMPDMMANLVDALKQIGPNINTIITAVNALSETPMNLTIDSSDKKGLQYALFEALKDYVHVDRGKFNISYIGE
jgi:hypothetical protein